MSKKWWNAALEPYANEYAGLLSAQRERIQKLEDEALKEFVRACEEPNTTNCGWQFYAIARHHRHDARLEAKRRGLINGETNE